MGEPMIVFGGGGHSVSVVSAALMAGMDIAGIYDDNPALAGTELFGVPVLGSFTDAPTSGLAFVAIGDNRTRKALVDRSSYRYATIIHPNLTTAHEVEIGDGAVLFAGCLVGARTVIGEHSIISAGTMLPHDTTIGRFVLIGPGVALGGAVAIGDLVTAGTGASLLPGVTIGEGATVGAGAVVLHDVPPGATVVGNPAKTKHT